MKRCENAVTGCLKGDRKQEQDLASHEVAQRSEVHRKFDHLLKFVSSCRRGERIVVEQLHKLSPQCDVAQGRHGA